MRRSDPLMPKPLLIFLACASLAIASCHSNSSVTPTPSGSPGSPAPNPSIKSAHLEVTILGTPAAAIPVEESTPANKLSPRPGTPFDTETTGKKGKVTFHHLKPSKTYCWVAVIAKSQEFSACANWEIWQTSVITLGT